MSVKSDFKREPEASADGHDCGVSEWFRVAQPDMFAWLVHRTEKTGWVVEYDKARCFYWFRPKKEPTR